MTTVRGVVGILVALLLSACAPDQPSTAAAHGALPVVRSGFREELRDGEAQLAGLRRDAVANVDGAAVRWLQQALELAQLTGDYRYFAGADEALQLAFSQARETSRPYVDRARWHYALHRISAARQDLALASEPFNPSAATTAEATAFLADLDFYSGNMTAAMRGYRAALSLDETPATLVRLAIAQRSQGHHSEALASLHYARSLLVNPEGQLAAFLDLQIGLIWLDAGRYDRALAHYDRADRAFPGWWLVQEHRAEALALSDQTQAAVALYREVLKTAPWPEMRVALAELLNAPHQQAEAAQLFALTEQGFRERLTRYPEAAAGHALDYFLAHGDPVEALALAEKNVQNRPYGGAWLQLAAAQLANRRAAAAEKSLNMARSLGWNTPEWAALLAQALEQQGKDAKAASATAKARNPRWRQQFWVNARTP